MKTQTILVVDDERPVRRLAELILQSAGYHVYTAGSAGDAISVARQLQCGLDLLLTDMQMPGIDGHELILAIRRICPHMGTMVFSGFMPDDARTRNYPVLSKPFTKDQLVAAVKQVLDAQL